MSNSEYLLHYIWKYRLFEQFGLKTTDGRIIEVLAPGIHNGDAGPDFFNAKVKIDDSKFQNKNNYTGKWVLVIIVLSIMFVIGLILGKKQK